MQPRRVQPKQEKARAWAAVVALATLIGCGSPGTPGLPDSAPGPVDGEPEPIGEAVELTAPPSATAGDPEAIPQDLSEGPAIHPPRAETPEEEARFWVEDALESMTLREKAGQLIMPWVLGDFAPEGSSSQERILGYVRDQGIGGVIMSVGSPTEVAAKLNALQAASKWPLLVAADLETGAGFRMRGAVQMPGTIELGGATTFPSLMAIGAADDPELAYEVGRITALEARAVGIHVPFAPVLDVNNNPDNPIINVRSFGEDPARVAALGSALVRGIQEHGGLATGKHFPGHGDTDTDSHIDLPVINHDRARMDAVELLPFRAAIDAGIGGMMTAHISVPSLNRGNRDPATLSAAVLTDLLRGELRFDGLLFTDAMDMSAIARRHRPEEAAVRAVEAGADVILMPPSPARAVDGIVNAVESGRLSEARIDASVRRILATKTKMGLHLERTVAIGDVPRVVGIPEHAKVATRIAERSITLLKNDGGLLPLRGTRTARVMSVSYRRQSDVLAGRYFDRRLRDTYPRLTSAELTQDSPEAIYEGLKRQAGRQALVVVSTYVTAVSYQGEMTLPEELVDFVDWLGAQGIPHVVVSFGNPYLVTAFPEVRAYMLAWSGSEASQRAAAGALFADFEISGRVPTRIPPLFEIGDGITIPKKEN